MTFSSVVKMINMYYVILTSQHIEENLIKSSTTYPFKIKYNISL